MSTGQQENQFFFKSRIIVEKPRGAITVLITLEFSAYSKSGLIQQTQPMQLGIESKDT